MGKLIVTANALNIRKEPSLDGKIIGVLQKGESVTEISLSSDQRWYKVSTNEDVEGWISSKYAARQANDNSILTEEEFDWMPIAIREIGIKEFNGIDANPRIVEYLNSTSGLSPAYLNSDETAWCSAFVNWCIEKAGYAGTNSAWARSWSNWGKKITTPRRGCIAVFKRGTNSGHVGFYIGKQGNNYKILGGNQGNEVCISTYSASKLIGFRISS